ncbi:MAG TPA: response regulator transcription factor [Anaerolineales bacterium]|nr:response regulator transcription factor [Anaerolineales bacterium]
MEKEPGLIKVLIIAPALAVRTGLRTLFGSMIGIEVIGESASLADLPGVPPETDVLVIAADSPTQMDLRQALQGSESVALLWLVQGGSRAAQVLVDLPARAWGILPLDTSAEELAAAVQALAEGLLVGSPALLKPLLARSRLEQEADEEPLIEPLTEREGQVLQLLAQGLANKQMALNLGISEHTVKFHVSAIYAKLGAANRTEAVRLGVQKGLVVL